MVAPNIMLIKARLTFDRIRDTWIKFPGHLLTLVAIFILVFLTVLVICYAAITVQSGVRAYVAGEGQWSKSEKDAYIYLSRYVDTGDERYFRLFREQMAVPIGDHDARLAMLVQNLDWKAATDGLIRGRNSPADIPVMIRMFRYAGRMPYMADAIAIWTKADPIMLQLAALGEQIHVLRASQPRNLGQLRQLRLRAFAINSELRPMEDDFSASLALGAQFINKLLLAVVALGALLAMLLEFLLVRRIVLTLHDSETRFRGMFEQAAVGLAHISLDGVILRVNDKYCAITGHKYDNLIDHSFLPVLSSKDAGDTWLHCGRLLRVEEQEYTTRLQLEKSDQTRWARITLTLVKNTKGEPLYFLNVLEDISRERRLGEQLSYLATHDALTQLVNRVEYEKRVSVALGKVASGGDAGAVFYLDLDQFKVINDTLGHMAGDELLRQLGMELKNRLRAGDTLARLGGDEFGVLLEGCPISAASNIAEGMRRTVDEMGFVWKGREYRVGVSIGVVPVKPDTESVQQLLSDADEACYIAKDKGRNLVYMHEPSSARSMQRQHEVQSVNRLREALDGEGLFLMFQSIQPLLLTHTTGLHFEMLLRMRQPSGEIVTPASFLPVAERYNLAYRVDEWVVRKTLGWLSDHLNEIHKIMLCSINLSAQSLNNSRFLEFLESEIYRSGVPTNKLCFELTEMSAVADIAVATKFINRIRDKGCRFALDDFGGGMSSFAHLHALPVDIIKIDGSFIRDMDRDSVNRALVSSINDISHIPGKLTIGEFVETDSILEAARELQLDYAQGYAVAKPSDLSDLFNRVAKESLTLEGPLSAPGKNPAT